MRCWNSRDGIGITRDARLALLPARSYVIPMAEKLRGIFTPNMVPLHDDGSINEAELRRYIDWLIASGVHGLYPNGSTGEFLRFTAEERRRIIQITCEQTAGRVQFVDRHQGRVHHRALADGHGARERVQHANADWLRPATSEADQQAEDRGDDNNGRDERPAPAGGHASGHLIVLDVAACRVDSIEIRVNGRSASRFDTGRSRAPS